MQMAPNAMMQPQIILLKEGTDTSQGKAQLISNINACQAVRPANGTDAASTWLMFFGFSAIVVSQLTTQ